MKTLFSDNSDFYMLDFSLSHSQLLFRSRSNLDRKYTIDILFKPVYNIISPIWFRKGIEISVVEDVNIIKNLVQTYGFDVDDETRIFQLLNYEKKAFYINAMVFFVYTTNLDILETSISTIHLDKFVKKQYIYSYPPTPLL